VPHVQELPHLLLLPVLLPFNLVFTCLRQACPCPCGEERVSMCVYTSTCVFTGSIRVIVDRCVFSCLYVIVAEDGVRVDIGNARPPAGPSPPAAPPTPHAPQSPQPPTLPPTPPPPRPEQGAGTGVTPMSPRPPMPTAPPLTASAQPVVPPTPQPPTLAPEQQQHEQANQGQPTPHPPPQQQQQHAAPPAAGPSPGDPMAELPEGWKRAVDKASGRTYYYKSLPAL